MTVRPVQRARTPALPSIAVRDEVRARRSRARAHRTPLAYLAPLFAALVVWVYGPLLFAIALSTLQWDLTTAPRFVGLGNYRTVLGDGDFGRAAVRTLLYMAGILPLAIGVPLLVAIALWRRPGRAAGIYRAVIFTPMMLAPVAVAVSWQFTLNPLRGPVRALFAAFGAAPPNWLGDPRYALWVIVLITSGKLIALNVLLLGSALGALDPSAVEAARVDGARESQITRLIVVPQLGRMLALLSMLSAVFVGQWSFTNVNVLTQGGPGGSTDNVYYRLYTLGFTDFDIGTASAGSVLVLVALAVPLLVGRLAVRSSRATR